MTDAFVLDVLLGAIVFLAMPLGFWRGVSREVFVSAGVLLGIALATAWADRWGRHATDWFDLGNATGRFVVAVSVVLVSTLIIGYGGAALGISETSVGLFGRMVGAFVAAANATVLLAWALAAIARDIADARAVDVMNDGILAGHLLRDGDWVLLVVAGGAAAAVVAGSVVTMLGRGRSLPEADRGGPGGRVAGPPNRLRPVRIARDTDEGKFEPEARQFDSRSGRYGADAAGLSTSIPLTHIDQSRWAKDTRVTDGLPPWGRQQDTGAAPQNGRFSGREWLRRSPPETQPAAGQCTACGAPMTAADAYCPRCGTTTSR